MFVFLLAVALAGQGNLVGLKDRHARHSKKTVKVVAKKQKVVVKKAETKKVVAKKTVARKSSTLKLPAALFREAKPVAKPEPVQKEKTTLSPAVEKEEGAIIVLDAGHGGDDPGAIGAKGLREKDVTLALAKRVKELIEQDLPGTKVFLTRETDKTLSLPARTDFANRMKADLFISIHVNSAAERSIRGIETYYLNISHDRYALRLAARENAMSESETSNLEFILADLAMKSSVTDSVRLGRIVQDSLCGNLITKWDDVKNLGLKHAMFYVLMGAKMPAILVETSFISNKTDEKRLKENDYQHAVAEGIVRGIRRYSEEKVASR